MKLIQNSNIVRRFANNTYGMGNSCLKIEVNELEAVARYAKAMGHPTRMAILNFLAAQDSCFFGDIFEVLPIAKATVSQHLKELKEAGLIQGEIEAPKVRYCINKPNWVEAQRLFDKFFGQRESCDVCCD